MSDAKGIDDVIKRDRGTRSIRSKRVTMEDLEDMDELRPRPELVGDDKRPPLYVTADLFSQMEQAKGLMPIVNTGPSAMFERSGEIVKIISSTGAMGNTTLKNIGVASLRGEMACKMRFMRTVEGKDGETKNVSTLPPEPLIKCIHGSPTEYGMKPLKGLVAYPVIRSDGTINSNPGYDEETCTFYAPGKSPMPPVSEYPTPLEIDRAKRLILDDVYGEFNFRMDGTGWNGQPVSASLCHAVCLALQHCMISQMSQTALRPPFLGQAGSPGSGKSLVVRSGIIVATGLLPDEMGTCRSDNEEEWTKQISRCLRSSPPAVIIDNVRGAQLNSASIDKLFTAPIFSARGMHSLDSVILDNNKIWAATSNNAIFIEDTARRFVYINLDNPKSKSDKSYSKENLLDWCLDNAGDLAWAVRTIIRGWVVAGRPKWRSLRPEGSVNDGAPRAGMPSYETWASVMGGLMDWLGIEGFLTNYKESSAAANVSGGDEDEFFLAMAKQFGEEKFFPIQCRDLLEYTTEHGPAYRLADAIRIPPGGTLKDRSTTMLIGKWLEAHRDQERFGIRLLSTTKRGKKAWRLTISDEGRDWIMGLDKNRDRELDDLAVDDIPL